MVPYLGRLKPYFSLFFSPGANGIGQTRTLNLVMIRQVFYPCATAAGQAQALLASY